MLELKDVTISYKSVPTVQHFNMSMKQGQIISLVGESGSGKSTILKAAMGLLGNSGRVTKGDICFQGNSLSDLSEKEFRKIRGEQIGMIFQDAGASLCPIRKIGSQIYESITAHKKMTREEAKEKALNLLEKLNFQDVERIWNSYPFELSGGMNQRVGIVLAMLMQPPVLLADEPTSALDVAVQRQVVQEILRLRELFGTAVILVTHDIGVVSALADTILVLKDGQVVEYGSARQILQYPEKEYTQRLLAAVPKLRRA